jgi:hypothetical protein
VHVWRVRAREVPAALLASRITARRLRRHPDVTFAKMLGTATDAFVPTAPTLQRWVAVVCGLAPDPVVAPWWTRHAVELASLTLRPLSSRGHWDGRDPFVVRRSDEATWSGPVVALTRSTLRLRALRRFYRAVPPVAAELRRASGCRLAFGIGEAPVVRQGTMSIWDSADAMTAFAYRSPQHAAVVAATPEQSWYAEELFTRFAVLDATGTIDGTAIA